LVVERGELDGFLRCHKGLCREDATSPKSKLVCIAPESRSGPPGIDLLSLNPVFASLCAQVAVFRDFLVCKLFG
jgi:hypothetical protein